MVCKLCVRDEFHQRDGKKLGPQFRDLVIVEQQMKAGQNQKVVQDQNVKLKVIQDRLEQNEKKLDEQREEIRNLYQQNQLILRQVEKLVLQNETISQGQKLPSQISQQEQEQRKSEEFKLETEIKENNSVDCDITNEQIDFGQQEIYNMNILIGIKENSICEGNIKSILYLTNKTLKSYFQLISNYGL